MTTGHKQTMHPATDPPDQNSGRFSVAGFGRRATILVSAMLSAAVVAGFVGFLLDGTIGLAAAILAMIICLGCGMLALAVSQALGEPHQLLWEVSLTMALRMGVPLAACLIVRIQGGALAEAGMIYYLLAFYFVTLLVETGFVVVRRSQSEPARSTSAKAT